VASSACHNPTGLTPRPVTATTSLLLYIRLKARYFAEEVFGPCDFRQREGRLESLSIQGIFLGPPDRTVTIQGIFLGPPDRTVTIQGIFLGPPDRTFTIQGIFLGHPDRTFTPTPLTVPSKLMSALTNRASARLGSLSVEVLDELRVMDIRALW
jgi:hypothetical protein